MKNAVLLWVWNMRKNSDYNCSYSATRKEIEPMIEPAGKLIEEIGKLIV